MNINLNCTVCLAVCGLLNIGVAAIFGPQSSHTASHVQSICDNMEVRLGHRSHRSLCKIHATNTNFQIPHLENRWDYRLRRESCLVNLYPHPNTLSKVDKAEAHVPHPKLYC